MKKFYICLTFDTDPDPLIEDSTIDNEIKNINGWSGLKYGFKKIFDKIHIIEKKYNLKIPMTWFVRVDPQIKSYHKKASWILERFKPYWNKVLKNDGSLQWHIHLNSKINNNWNLEKSIKKIEKMIKENYKVFSSIQKKPICIRIGEAFMNNELMKIIKKTGLLADSSAIPGRKRSDRLKYFDWSKAPNEPYFISPENYQKKTKLRLNKYIKEIPMNTMLTKTSYDKKYIKRYFNLSFHNKILKKKLNEYINKKDILVTMTHPYEILEKFKTSSNSKLVSFSISEFEKNIINILKLCKKNNKMPVFINIEKLIY